MNSDKHYLRMKMKKLNLTLLLIVLYSTIFGQNPIVVVDGFFLNLKKGEVIEFIGKENIKDTLQIAKDSAMVLLGKYGDDGLFIINTTNPSGKESSLLRAGNRLYFTANPVIFVDGIKKDNLDLNTIDPQTVESIEIISPLTSLKEKGFDYIGGMIKIYLKKK
jgi:hypothetical protein